MVDVVGQLGVEVAQRVVGQGREVDDGVEAREVGGLDGANVLLEGTDGFPPVPKSGTPVQIGVQADDLMARLDHHGRHDRPDVAPATGQKELHRPAEKAQGVPPL